MDNIKNFSDFVNENVSDEDLNYLLDKVNKEGFDSLTSSQKKVLQNYGYNKEKGEKEELIEEIKYKVEKYGQHITMGEMQAESSPVFSDSGEFQLVETLKTDKVEVVVYGGYKNEQEIDTFEVPYEKLELDTLYEIKDILDGAIETGLIDEDK